MAGTPSQLREAAAGPVAVRADVRHHPGCAEELFMCEWDWCGVDKGCSSGASCHL